MSFKLEPCNVCGNSSTWVRKTQFCGDHFFCTEHALKENDFCIEDGCTIWYEIIHTFIPDKFSKPTVFLKNVNKDDFFIVQLGEGFCQLKTLKDVIRQVEQFKSNKLYKIFNIFKKYAIQQETKSPKSCELVINVEKLTSDINLGIIDQRTIQEITCLEKEGHIKTNESFLNMTDPRPLKKVLFLFN